MGNTCRLLRPATTGAMCCGAPSCGSSWSASDGSEGSSVCDASVSSAFVVLPARAGAANWACCEAASMQVMLSTVVYSHHQTL